MLKTKEKHNFQKDAFHVKRLSNNGYLYILTFRKIKKNVDFV